MRQTCLSILVVVVLLFISNADGFSQQLKLGKNPSAVQKSAVLELESPNQGLLFPRLADTTSINSFSPPDGMVIYLTPAKQLYVRSNGRWSVLTSGTIDTTNISNFYQKVRGLLSAGTGISYNNTTGVITNSAPDQTVSLTSGTGVSVGGAYPNFTIANTAPDQTVALTAGTGIGITGTYPNFTIANNSPSSGGTVTSVTSANTDASVATPTTTPVITINSAPKLTTARTIQGVSFDGSANINILNGTGFVKANGTTLSYDNSTYLTSVDTTNISNFGSKVRSRLSAGTGISYNSTTGVITNSAPDQTVALTAGTGIGVSGTYPNFTITNSSPNQAVSLTAGTGISVSGTYPNFTIANNSLSSGGTVTSVTSANNAHATVASTTTTPVITIVSAPKLTTARNIQGVAFDGSVDINPINGTGLVRANGTTITYDNNTYLTSVDTTNISNFGSKVRSRLSAGTGITYNNTTGVITNSAPDQTVALTAGTGIGITGTYPNFTIANNSLSSGGTVTSVSVTTANGVSGAVTNPTTTPAISLTLGAITPTSVAATGTVTGSNLSGTNTGNVTLGTANGLSLTGQALSLGLASGSAAGALSAADWTTFNNKLSSNNVWTRQGNAGTNPGTDFIGTTDAQDLIFKTSGNERWRIQDASGDIKIGDANSGTFKATKELVMRQDGDLYGSSILRLRNRNAENGAIFETTTTDPGATLVDFIFKTSVNQRNIRYESRSTSTYNLVGVPAFHIAGSNPDVPTLAVGDNYAAVRNYLRIGGYTTPAEVLDVTGNVRFSGALMPGGSAGTSGQILQSNGAGAAPTWVAAPSSGLPDPGANGIVVRTSSTATDNVTIIGTNNRITVTNGSGVSGNPTIDISSSYAGQNTITTVGTIGTGVWNGTKVAEGYGGTNQTTYTKGDILYASAANTLTKLNIGSAGDRLNVIGGVPVWEAPATSQSTPADPTSTTNTTGRMMGLAGSITPATSGRIMISISGDIDNNTIGSGGQVQIRYGTGTAPANAANIPGTSTAAGSLIKMVTSTVAARYPFTCNAVVTGLTIGTAYWIDLSLAAITGGTARIRDISISVIEL